MMFAFPKQQQKSCCVLEHARAASLLPLFLCTTRACFHPLLDVKEGFPMYLRSLETITISLRRREGKNSTSFMLFLVSHDFGHAWRRQIWEALRMLNQAITTSILTVESRLAFAGIFWCWGVEHRCRLLCPLISEVRFSSARWNERTTDRIV